MGTLKTCDVCLGVIKDKPIQFAIQSDNQMFKKHRPDAVSEEAFSLFQAIQGYQSAYMMKGELCEFCGLKLIGLIEAAKKVGKAELEQFKGLLA